MMRSLLLLVPLSMLPAQSPPAPIENEFVRVVYATDQPVAKPGALHEHKQNRVMIYLDPGDMQIRYADGRIDNQHWKAGEVAWSAAGGMHTSQNVSKAPIRIVEIEVRSPGVTSETVSRLFKPIIDNPQVLVYENTQAPAGRHYVAVDLKAGAAFWDRMPAGPGPFIITELK